MTTPIHEAAESGDAPAVARLLSADPALVSSLDKLQNTPLHKASSIAVAELLLDHHADVNARGWMGATPLHEAAQRGAADIAELLLRAGAEVNAQRTERLDTPLHWAANESVAQLLAQHGAEIEPLDWAGRTPLHWAAQNGRADVATFLIQHGANVEGRRKVVTKARPRSSGTATGMLSRLLTATKRAIDAMLPPTQGFSSEESDETPLHWAAQEGHTQVAALLLDRGAELNAKNANGQTPLHLAAFRGHGAVVELLIRAGAAGRIRDKSGRTPLHIAQRTAIREQLTELLGPEPSETPSLASPERLGFATRDLCEHSQRAEVISTAQNGLLARWDTSDGPRLVLSLQTNHPWISEICRAPSSDQFYTAAPDGIEVRDWATLRLLDMLLRSEQRQDAPTAIDASPDGRWLAVAKGMEEVLLVDLATQTIKAKVDAGERTMSVKFSPSSRMFAIACSFQGGGCVRVYELTPDGQLSLKHEFDRNADWSGHRPFVDTLCCVQFSPDGRYLATYDTSGTYYDQRLNGWRGNLAIYQLASGSLLWTVLVNSRLHGDDRTLREAGHPMGFVTQIAFINDEAIVCGSTRGSLLFLAVADGRLLRREVLDTSAAVLSVAVGHQGRTLHAGLENGRLVGIDL
ncbi:MAG TPA: ankyrin repeat domain-containing protein [Humisphaera sp.]|nr:ankyrin repeat domain-containing protein [Humisphaera sp.]